MKGRIEKKNSYKAQQSPALVGLENSCKSSEFYSNSPGKRVEEFMQGDDRGCNLHF